MSTITESTPGIAGVNLEKPSHENINGSAYFSTFNSGRLSYTIQEAAAATGLTKRKIEGAILRGELRHKIIGKTTIISASSLKKLVGELP